MIQQEIFMYLFIGNHKKKLTISTAIVAIVYGVYKCSYANHGN